MKRLLIVGAITASALLSGCATWSTGGVEKQYVANDAIQTVAKKDPSAVILSDQDFPDRPYTAIGDISVTVNKTTVFNADPTPTLVNEKLREKGAELGADAVILVRYGKVGMSFFSWGSLEGKGRAIKFNP